MVHVGEGRYQNGSYWLLFMHLLNLIAAEMPLETVFVTAPRVVPVAILLLLSLELDRTVDSTAVTTNSDS